MSTGQYSYALDVLGTNPANKVTDELHTVTAVNDRTYHFIVPTFAPFYANTLKLAKVDGQNLIPLVEGVDWHPSLQFQGASTVTAKPVYGAISFTDLQFAGTVQIEEYQTLGGEYTLDLSTMNQVIGDIVYNPRGLTWEQVTNLQKMFPPIDHPWDFNNLAGTEELIEAIGRIEAAILAGATSDLDAHIRDQLNPHRTNKNQVGLSLVENFPPATLIQAIQGTSNTSLITPMTLRGVLSDLGLLAMSDALDLMRAHIENRQNPHQTDKQQIQLGDVENLPVATPTDILGKRRVRKYITLDGLIDYMALHGCGADAEEPNYPPKDALLSTYCNNVNKMGVYANGQGGTYEKVMEINSRDCGYVPPPPNPAHPPMGTLLNKYCVGYDQYATYADGYGGSYTRQLGFNSPDCGYPGGPPPTGCPAAGTILGTRCDGTTLVKTIANGSCSSYEERVANDENCEDNVECPPTGQLLSTFCQGFNLMGKYTNGSCGTYDAIVTVNSPDCGYSPPVPTFTPPPFTPPPFTPPPFTPPPFTPPPGTPAPSRPTLTLNVSPNALSVGQTATMQVSASSLTSGRRYVITFYRKHFNQGSYQQYSSTVTFSATGSTYSGSFSISNGGDLAQGASDFKGEIQIEGDANTRNTSNNVQVMFYANRTIALTLNGSSSATTVTIGQEVEVRNDYRDFPIPGLAANSTITVGYEITGAENRYAGPFQITMNSSGSDSRIGRSTIAQDMNTRGQVNYRVRAEWIDATGQQQVTYSNYVSINWIGSGGGGTPAPTGGQNLQRSITVITSRGNVYALNAMYEGATGMIYVYTGWINILGIYMYDGTYYQTDEVRQVNGQYVYVINGFSPGLFQQIQSFYVYDGENGGNGY